MRLNSLEKSDWNYNGHFSQNRRKGSICAWVECIYKSYKVAKLTNKLIFLSYLLHWIQSIGRTSMYIQANLKWKKFEQRKYATLNDILCVQAYVIIHSLHKNTQKHFSWDLMPWITQLLNMEQKRKKNGHGIGMRVDMLCYWWCKIHLFLQRCVRTV